MADFQLQIITPERRVFDRTVMSLVAPGGLGYLGVLAYHAPLLTTLVRGELRVTEAPGREFVYEIDGGFLEVSSNVATVLADGLTPVSVPADEAEGDGEE